MYFQWRHDHQKVGLKSEYWTAKSKIIFILLWEILGECHLKTNHLEKLYKQSQIWSIVQYMDILKWEMLWLSEKNNIIK